MLQYQHRLRMEQESSDTFQRQPLEADANLNECTYVVLYAKPIQKSKKNKTSIYLMKRHS